MEGIWAKGYEVPKQWQNTQGECVVSWRESTALSKVNYCCSQGQGRGETWQWWRQSVTESLLQCEGSQASWAVEGHPMSPGLCQSKWMMGRDPIRIFPFYLSFKSANTIAKPYLQKWMDKPLRTRKKDKHLEKRLLEATKDSLMSAPLFMGWETEKTP